jgi:hypothetical protein
MRNWNISSAIIVDLVVHMSDAIVCQVHIASGSTCLEQIIF